MQPTSDKLTRILLNHYFDKSSRSSGSGGNWRSNVLPKMKIVPLGGRLNSLLAGIRANFRFRHQKENFVKSLCDFAQSHLQNLFFQNL